MIKHGLSTLAWLTVCVCAFPIASVGITAISGTLDTWTLLADTVLPRYLLATIQLVFWVGIGTALIGTGTAWLVAVCEFPGRRIFEVALALPFAFPAYVLAYAYTDLLDHPGAVQTALRQWNDWGPRDYWFPEIRSLGGAAIMLILVLYPYVYLLARASFIRQSPTAYQAARVLGRSPLSAFFTVSLPLARPAIAGGVILALMETVADFGTVSHFAVQTFATGIYQAWIGMGDRSAASQLALCLMGVAFVLIILERIERQRRSHFEAGKRIEAMPRHRLTGRRALAAIVFCAIPVLAGFVIPLLVLLEMAWDSGQNPFAERYIMFISNSLLLASTAACVTVCLAIAVGYRARINPGKAAEFTKTIAGLGYAIPGSVIAVGVFIPFASFDNAFDAYMREAWGISTGLLLSGSMFILLVAYAVRFMAVAISSFDTGMAQIKPTMDAAARTLGAGHGRILFGVHLPLMRASLLTGALIVFVDVMKELPATLMLRPFNFDTLAVHAYRLASDERLTQAAVPSLVIVAFGLLPVIILCRTIAMERPAHHTENVQRFDDETFVPAMARQEAAE
ncbi:MAG: iron ABC transporter permease [Pseudomonadota bacterium]